MSNPFGGIADRGAPAVLGHSVTLTKPIALSIFLDFVSWAKCGDALTKWQISSHFLAHWSCHKLPLQASP